MILTTRLEDRVQTAPCYMIHLPEYAMVKAQSEQQQRRMQGSLEQQNEETGAFPKKQQSEAVLV